MKTFPDGTEHRRYVVSGERGQWLATVFLGAEGVFSTVSDYGNYGYWWTGIGGDGDIRRFLCGCDASYLTGKFAPRWEADADASEVEIKRCIIRLRRAGKLSAEEAREEWGLLFHVRDGDEGGWWANTNLGEHAFPSELWHYCRPPQAVAFVERVMPRLCEMLRAELAAEKAATWT